MDLKKTIQISDNNFKDYNKVPLDGRILEYCITGAIFKDGYRKKANIIDREPVILIDYENDKLNFAKLLKALNDANLSYISFKSPGQYKIQGDECRRRVIVLSEPLSIEGDEFTYQMEKFFDDINYDKELTDWGVTGSCEYYFAPPVIKNVYLVAGKNKNEQPENGITLKEAKDSIITNSGDFYKPSKGYMFSTNKMLKTMKENERKIKKENQDPENVDVFEKFNEDHSVLEFIGEWFIKSSGNRWTYEGATGTPGVSIVQNTDIGSDMIFNSHSNGPIEPGAYSPVMLYCLKEYGNLDKSSWQKLGKRLGKSNKKFEADKKKEKSLNNLNTAIMNGGLFN